MRRPKLEGFLSLLILDNAKFVRFIVSVGVFNKGFHPSPRKHLSQSLTQEHTRTCRASLSSHSLYCWFHNPFMLKLSSLPPNKMPSWTKSFLSKGKRT